MPLPTKMHLNFHLAPDVAEVIRDLMSQTEMSAQQVIEHFFRDIKKWETVESIELNKGIIQKPDGTIVKQLKKRSRLNIVIINR
jgi:hypothetical protein